MVFTAPSRLLCRVFRTCASVLDEGLVPTRVPKGVSLFRTVRPQRDTSRIPAVEYGLVNPLVYPSLCSKLHCLGVVSVAAGAHFNKSLLPDLAPFEFRLRYPTYTVCTSLRWNI